MPPRTASPPEFEFFATVSTIAKNSNRQDPDRQATVPFESGIQFNTDGMKILIVLHLTMQCKCGSIALQMMDRKKEITACRAN